MEGTTRVMYVDADPDRCRTVSAAIERECETIAVTCESDPDRVVETLDRWPVACLVCAHRLDGTTCGELVEGVRGSYPDLPVIVFASEGLSAVASDALAAGATDVLEDAGEDYAYELLATRVERAARNYRDRRPIAAGDDQYQRLFRRAPVMFVVTRNRGAEPVVDDCNERFLDRLGYARGDVLDEPLAAFYTSDSRAVLLEGGGYERALEAEFTTEERELVAADGTVVETVLRAVPRVCRAGEVIGTFALFVDVSRYRGRERQLDAIHSATARLVESTSEAGIAEILVETADEVLELPATAAFLYDEATDRLRPAAVTESARDLFDEIPTFYPGDSIAWEVFQEGETRVVDDVRDHPAVYNPDTPVRSELYVPLEGHGVFLSGTSRVDAFDESDVRFAQTLARNAVAALDRTEREANLRERSRNLRTYETIVATAPEPIYALDPDARFDAVNPAMVELTGYARGELLGADLSLVMSDDDAGSVETAVEGLVTGEHDGGPIEVVVTTAGGGRRTCLATLSVLPFRESFRGSVGILRDVTERKRRQQRLEVMDRVLRHNLRNEINVVRGRASVLERKLSPRNNEHVSEIRDSADSLISVSEKVRWANSAFRDIYDLEVIDVGRIVQVAVDHARGRWPHADVRADVPDEARAHTHEALRICIDELVENAVVHNDAPRPTVEVTVERRTAPPGIAVVIRDDGPGLPDHERRILEGARESQLEHGSGLGLWLVRWIVVESGGEIHATTPDGGGTEITVLLPDVDE